MTTLHLMVGLPCSGKSTLARRLERELPALRLTPDHWHVRLYGQDAEDPAHDRRHEAIEALLWDVAERVLTLGVSVILDTGFWVRSQRDELHDHARRLDVHFRIHYTEAAETELIKRLKERNTDLPDGAFAIPEASLRTWFTIFEPPTGDELASTTVYS